MAGSFIIGRGTQIFIAPLQVGDELEPNPATLTIGSTAIAKGQTELTLSAALPTGVFIPKFCYLGFRASTGKEVLVQLNDDAKAGNNKITVFPTPAQIAGGSIADYPLRLANRTSADITRTGATTSSTTFDDDGWQRNLTTGLSGGISVPGNWSQLDPSYKTVIYQFAQQLNVYVWVESVKPNPDYATGTIFKGVFNVQDVPVNFAADGIVTGDINLTLTGPLVEVDPEPTP
jgi:hypothetical protein